MDVTPVDGLQEAWTETAPGPHSGQAPLPSTREGVESPWGFCVAFLFCEQRAQATVL